VGALARAGGGGNVTVPHKTDAARACDRTTARAARLGAVNTFWLDADGAVVGDNTDVDGVLAALDALDAGAERAWAVVGTGGAARAVAAAAAARGARLAVCSRAGERAAAFLAWAAELGVAPATLEECGVVINSTPLGLGSGDLMPISRRQVPGASAALDLVYARGETPWVRALRAQGLRAADGRTMLVAQGAAAFERWFPELRAPVDVMRGAVEAALR
jgi:shikimate dehydrogenase